jgi:hypothetical protein
MAEEILGEGGDGEDTAASDSALTGSDEADAAKAATDEARELALAEDKATQTDDTSKDALSDEGKDGVPENYGDFILPEGVESSSCVQTARVYASSSSSDDRSTHRGRE